MSEFRVSLHPGQAAIYNSPARFKVCAAGRRFGKSHLAGLTLGIEALRTQNERGYTLTIEHGVYYIAPTFDQAKRVMWPKLRSLLGYEAAGGLISNENTNDGWIELINGRRIYIKGADNPDSLRGIGLSYVVLDEYADMKPNVWSEIVEPALMDVEGAALFIGTPKGKNHFYKMFMKALQYKHDPAATSYPEFEAFHFKSLDNPFLNERELKRIMESDNRPLEVIRQEIEASFVSGGGRVLHPDNFPVISGIAGSLDAQREGANYVVASQEGSYYVTVDLAGFKKQEGNKLMRTDDSVIAVTCVSPDSWIVVDVQHGHWDVRETALRIVRTCARYPNCRLGIEKGALANAIGPYLDDYMREFHRYITPEPLSHNNNKKADRIQWALQGRSERNKIKLLKGDWNNYFLDQISDFPDPLAHDDAIDAVSYVDQMAAINYSTDEDIVEWAPLDLDSGY